MRLVLTSATKKVEDLTQFSTEKAVLFEGICFGY
jgi:hypothetical protein